MEGTTVIDSKANQRATKGVASRMKVLLRLLPLLLAVAAWWYSPALDNYQALLYSGWLLYGILALSLDWVWGQAGIFSFGQPLFFGLGAYAYGAVAINLSDATGETVSALVSAAIISAIVGAVLGLFMFYGGISDVYVAVITLAATLVFFTVVGATAGSEYAIGSALLGGYNGMNGIPPITTPWTGPITGSEMFALYAAIAAVGLVVLLFLRTRPSGRTLAAIRENEVRAELIGIDVRRHKLVAFTTSAFIAGVAGGLYGAWGGLVTPQVFSLTQMALVVIWVLVGGRGTLYGPFIGVILVQALSTNLASTTGFVSENGPLLLGALLILIVLVLPGGLLPVTVNAVRRVAASRRGAGGPAGADVDDEDDVTPRTTSVPEELRPSRETSSGQLNTIGAGRSFGAVHAVKEVSLSFTGPGIYSLIGPNGAGKSTYFSLLTGRNSPTRGDIVLDDRSIRRLAPSKRARLGIGVKMQKPSVFPGLSPRENLWLAGYAQGGGATRADDLVGIVSSILPPDVLRDTTAGALSHGEMQWLDIGMVLAGTPRFVLLDEPAAGMTRAETASMVPLLRSLAEHVCVLVVEHDMDFVASLQGEVVVLHEGSVFTRGSIDDVRRNQRVMDIYLGRGTYARST